VTRPAGAWSTGHVELLHRNITETCLELEAGGRTECDTDVALREGDEIMIHQQMSKKDKLI